MRLLTLLSHVSRNASIIRVQDLPPSARCVVKSLTGEDSKEDMDCVAKVYESDMDESRLAAQLQTLRVIMNERRSGEPVNLRSVLLLK